MTVRQRCARFAVSGSPPCRCAAKVPRDLSIPLPPLGRADEVIEYDSRLLRRMSPEMALSANVPAGRSKAAFDPKSDHSKHQGTARQGRPEGQGSRPSEATGRRPNGRASAQAGS